MLNTRAQHTHADCWVLTDVSETLHVCCLHTADHHFGPLCRSPSWRHNAHLQPVVVQLPPGDDTASTNAAHLSTLAITHVTYFILNTATSYNNNQHITSCHSTTGRSNHLYTMWCKLKDRSNRLTFGGIASRSPLGSVRSLLSSRTEFKFSTHSGSTSPSNTIHCRLPISPRTLSMILHNGRTSISYDDSATTAKMCQKFSIPEAATKYSHKFLLAPTTSSRNYSVLSHLSLQIFCEQPFSIVFPISWSISFKILKT